MRFSRKKWAIAICAIVVLVAYQLVHVERVQGINQFGHTDEINKYTVSLRGFGIRVGGVTFDVPAARNSSETNGLLIQYGSMTVNSAPDTFDFTDNNLSNFIATPTLLGNPTIRRTQDADTLLVAQVTSVSSQNVIFSIRTIGTESSMAVVGTFPFGTLTVDVDIALIGPIR